MTLLVEVGLAAELLDAHGVVTDLVAPSLAEPGGRRLLLEALPRYRRRPPPRTARAAVPGHGEVWAAFDPGLGQAAGEAAIRWAVDEGAMAPVWTCSGV